jgi:hypothetical protein
MLVRSMSLYVPFLATVLLLTAYSAPAFPDGEILEFMCSTCGYRQQFAQGFDQEDERRNVQSIVVVCERTHEIRTIKVALNPNAPVSGEPLLARQFGTGRSELLGMRLPRFLVPGNTCPLFPITAYLQHGICPIDGRFGFHFTVVGYF